MSQDKNTSLDVIMAALQERAKELNCLYKVEELLNRQDENPDHIFNGIVKSLPPGWQYPDKCFVKLIIYDKTYQSPILKETIWKQQADILVQGKIAGTIIIYYSEEKPLFDEGPFLKEERKLINTISEMIGSYLLHTKLKNVFHEWQNTRLINNPEKKKGEWKIAVEMLKETDHDLYQLISRKMMNFLCWSGVKEAEMLLQKSGLAIKNFGKEMLEDENKPIEKKELDEVREKIFNIAEENLSDNEILYRIQKWIQEDKSSFLIRILENLGTTLPEIGDAIRRYLNIAPEYSELAPAIEKGVDVALIRRFLSDQLQFISIAKNFVEIKDFFELLQKMIYPAKSHGKLGGKSVGLFIASKILKNSTEYHDLFKDIKIPKTWYITSDAIIEFLHYNNLEEVFEQKYKDLDQIRQEYPYIVQVFKNSQFPPEIMKDLSLALDDFGNVPLIVRSSSLLEDRMGAAFSGKYKSLFVANQG
ncbi:MAG: PEP/pyruvate-binding domain-containing protein, partial [Ignavibacteria bacterium]